MQANSQMTGSLRKDPIIYEINTWIWLRELSIKYQQEITLGNIPGSELDELEQAGFTAIWLMGVWQRSPAGIAIAKQHKGIMKDLQEALPDLEEDDIVGSPYCIKDYHVDGHLGGDSGLALARKAMADRGMMLILDFVPNHVAPDHPWTVTDPGFFINGSEGELGDQPENWYHAGTNIYARARDPFYPPWPDVLQLNVFNGGLQTALVNTLKSIASMCDGIRCDMAMLVMNDIFDRTWGGKAGPYPERDFWSFVIPEIKKHYPHFLFIAEAYWDKEQVLIEQGFDFCYDKKFYDYLEEGAERSEQHLWNLETIQDKLLRFLENHDEKRAANFFPISKHKAFALASLTLPGARLLHEGQLDGRTVKVPVFLSRRPHEMENSELKSFYLKLVKMLQYDAVKNGKWALCEVSGWYDNLTCLNLLTWEWIGDRENLMVIVNLSDQPAQALVKSGYSYLTGRSYQLYDVISGVLYDRDGDDLNDPGLFVGLQEWGVHTFLIEH